jgi:SAM-dependent methyltransferase
MLNFLKGLRVVVFLQIALGFFLIGQLLLLVSKWIITLTYYNSNYKRGLKEDFYLMLMNLKFLIAPKIASKYFAGFPYQSLEYPLMFGDRAILRRLEEYGILGSISKEHTVLDLGCAEGFMGIKISQLTGASVLNVEHNEVAVKRGLSLIKFLKLSNVQYLLRDLRSFEPQNKFDRILAMAAYATDDGGIQMTLFEYLNLKNIKHKTSQIILIEPSELALKRASLHIKKFLPHVLIDTKNKDLDSLTDDDFKNNKNRSRTNC